MDNSKAAVQALTAGQTVTDKFSVVSSDGTANRTVTITITGVNDVPLLGGTATGGVTEDEVLNTATGTLTIADADTGQSSFTAQVATAGIYGSLLDHGHYIVDNWETRDEIGLDEAINFVKGPDFPTGGQILGTEGIRQAFDRPRPRARTRPHHHRREPQRPFRDHHHGDSLPGQQVHPHRAHGRAGARGETGPDQRHP